MKTLYLDLAHHDSVQDSFIMSSDYFMYCNGDNLGNFAFRRGLSNMIDLKNCEIISHDGVPSQQKYNNVVLSCANWISDSPLDEEKNKKRYDILEKLDCPVSAFGLGAQANLNQQTVKIGEYTKRVLSLFSERASLISVRDNFTQELLDNLGINNTIVTGCPSNFLNFDPQIENHIYNHAKYLLDNNEERDTKVHVTECSSIDDNSAFVQKIIEFIADNNASYVLQSPELMPFMRDRASLPQCYDFKDMRLEKALNSKSIYFSSTNDWLEFSRTCDVSFGMRIHGNMIPLQAARPSMLIHHDSRTKGLADTMAIPSMSISEFSNIDQEQWVKVVLERNIELIHQYGVRRRELHSKFMDLIDRNNLSANNSFENMFS